MDCRFDCMQFTHSISNHNYTVRIIIIAFSFRTDFTKLDRNRSYLSDSVHDFGILRNITDQLLVIQQWQFLPLSLRQIKYICCAECNDLFFDFFQIWWIIFCFLLNFDRNGCNDPDSFFSFFDHSSNRFPAWITIDITCFWPLQKN